MSFDFRYAALAGASGEVARTFLANLSDRLLSFIHEEMEQWNGTEEDILEAQKKVLAIGSFCLNHGKERMGK